ncbi:hypothetical protein COU24_03660 [Candidatus Kuenenbacteria bacterium CG10_big_fil_rev_8_21_14_0_10_39_14]|uniref:O-antigen ligase-related domain-containing protein n=1 Tax=Candidatus Kuenenbacteria bacterium CG10_big_fil_rev_8_21_14_0_10_39_14 TaxID=1974619 RepID=A0A2H0U519_9BACT|nr:O-antigen ligase family protein [Candidatus Kuenenbacteria bacterium]PIR80487.1 MAG: hypothetical protein COU24_03660 [Candidatus Kuenenbacteria bacterium CG10_big_fil_rev_8_21_14_0_10_39_14]
MNKLLKLSKKLPEYLFYLFVFLLPWQTRWIFHDSFYQGEVFEYWRMSLYSFDIILIILLLYYLIAELKNLTVKKLRIFNIALLSYCLIVLLSVIWADEKLIAWYWGVRMFLGCGLFYLIQKIDFSRLRLAIVVVIAGAIQGLLGIWQFLNQNVWQSKWLGMAGQSARDLGASVVEFGLERWLRAYGSWPHPNIYGAFLVLSFIGVIYLVTKIKDKYHQLFLVFSSSFIALGILFSYSRAAWLGFGLVFIAGIIWLCKTVKDEWLKKFIKWLWLYLFLLLVLFTLATWPIVKTRLHLGETARLETTSNMERAAGYRVAKEIIKDNFLLGVGVGNYANELKERYPDEKVWYIQPVHNIPLIIFGELGIIGFLIVILLNCYIVKLLFKKRDWSYLSLLFIVYCLLFFDHFWWTLSSGLYVLWLVMGLVFKEHKEIDIR